MVSAYSQQVYAEAYSRLLLRKDWELVIKRLAKELPESSRYSSSGSCADLTRIALIKGVARIARDKTWGGTHSTPMILQVAV
jgi:hypothetical protein